MLQLSAFRHSDGGYGSVMAESGAAKVTLNFNCNFLTLVNIYVILGLELFTLLFTCIAFFTPRWISQDFGGSIAWSIGLYEACVYSPGLSACFNIQGTIQGLGSYFSALYASLAFMCVAFALELISIFVFVALFMKKLAHPTAIKILMVTNGIITFSILLSSSIFAGKAISGISQFYDGFSGISKFNVFKNNDSWSDPHFDYSFILSWFAMIFALCTTGLLVAFWKVFAQQTNRVHETRVSSNIEEVRRQQTVATVQVRHVAKVEERSEHFDTAVVHQRGGRDSENARGRRYDEVDTASVSEDVEIE